MRPGRFRRSWLPALALLAVVLVFGTSFVLLAKVIGIASPWLSVLLLFYFLGIAKVAEPLLKLRMPDALYRLRRWEERGDVPHRLRVAEFGGLLRRTPLRFLNAGVYLDRQRPDPLKVRLQVESAEAIHFWAAVLFLPFIARAAVSGRWSVAVCFSLTQLLLNVYPILHLRQVRRRLDRVVRKRRGARRADPFVERIDAVGPGVHVL